MAEGGGGRSRVLMDETDVNLNIAMDDYRTQTAYVVSSSVLHLEET